jgi:hypothetical protein
VSTTLGLGMSKPCKLSDHAGIVYLIRDLIANLYSVVSGPPNVSTKARYPSAASMQGGRARRSHRYSPGDAEVGSHIKASFIHIDCDLYAGTRDALLYLSSLIQPGTVLVFDELINYPRYAEHEIKALWEWLASSGMRVRVIGGFGPLKGASHTMDMTPVVEHGSPYMSVALLVV